MNIEYKPTSPQAEVKEDIILNGRKIGTVQPYVPAYGLANGDKYQVQLHFGNQIYPGGFGVTKEEAIANALQIATEIAAAFVAEVSALRAEMELT